MEEQELQPQLMTPTLKMATTTRREQLLPLRRTSLDPGSSGSPLTMEESNGSRVQAVSNPPLITVAINYGGIDLARTAMTVTISLSLGQTEN